MGINYLWDTNTVIYFLQGHFTNQPVKVREHFADSKPIISVITEIELLCWKTTKAEDIEVIQRFISESLIIELDTEIKSKTAEIRKATGLKLPDAIIAASAIARNLVLVTRNLKDFEKVATLKTLNPWSV